MLASLALAGPASAHVGGGAAGSDFDGRVDLGHPGRARGDGARPAVRRRPRAGQPQRHRGRGARLLRTSPTCGSARTASGATRAARRPTSTSTGTAASPLPGEVDPPRPSRSGCSCPPQPHYVWHDHRTHWMTQGQLPPAVAADPGRSHTVSEWTVPLRYGDTAGGGRRACSPGARRPRRGWSGRSTRRSALLAAAAGLLARSRPAARRAAARRRGRGAVARAGRRRCRRSASPRTPGRSSRRCCRRSPPRWWPGIGFRAARRGRGGDDRAVRRRPRVAAAGAGAAGRRRALVGERAHQRPAGGWAGSPSRCWSPLGAGLVVGGIAAVRRFRDVGAPEPVAQPAASP